MHWRVAISCLLLLQCRWICAVTVEETDVDQSSKSESELLGCLKTPNTDDIRKMRLNIFKQELLLRLNLDKEPENPPPEVVQKYKKKFSQEYDAVRASHQLQDKEIKPCVEVDKRVSRLIVFFPDEVGTEISSAAATDNASPLVDTLRFKFTVDLIGHQEVTDADLRLYKLVVDNTATMTDERIDIYSVYSDVDNYYDEDLKFHATAGNVKTDKDGYTIFNISDAIEDWKERTPSLKGELIFQVEIRTKEKEGFSLPPKIQYASDNATTQLVIRTLLDKPALNSTEHELVSELYKRNAETTQDNTEISDCALQSLVLDFRADYNWTWVLHPDTLTLNYCSGICGRVNAENLHTEYLATRAAVLSNPVGASEPCCIPNSFESATLSIAVPGPEISKLEKVERLTITSCVCR